ncbi:cyclopropane-fatty-acyl-phospholipid synthase [Alteromonadaceae bacterium Bs31]|nr:cyclopropane-fatty-acyl-phospholipid synthase [Alteromonadaceae bacterium Bs31]
MDSASISDIKTFSVPTFTLMDVLARRFVLGAFSKLKIGHLVLEEEGEVFSFGQALVDSRNHAHIVVKDKSAYFDFFFNGTIGSAEAYMRGAWTTPDLLSVVRLMVANLEWLSRLNAGRPWLSRAVFNVGHFLKRNSKQGSQQNIAAHYDLGNDFFELFLDPTMMYSSAIYPSADAGLEEASTHKLETICRKLKLKDTDHLLEIGTGWGGMAIYAAQNYGCKVTTTTISREQYEFAKNKVASLGLQDQITLLLKDYRDLEGQYDKVVSIEMIEAVGHQFYENYFSVCNGLLKSDGLMLIQAITIPDQRYEYAKASVDFIKKYIFPGGCLPSNEVIAACISKYTDMQIIDLHDITDHYAKTLNAWYQDFRRNVDKVVEQGFDDVFCRMWEFYLLYCEGGFRERVISTSQVLFAKPGYRVDEQENSYSTYQ